MGQREYKAYGQVAAACLANWLSQPIYLAFNTGYMAQQFAF
jgi:hypothetical protein